MSRMTDRIVLETQLAAPAGANDNTNGYKFKAFEEGPGSALDDPKKNYLRQVRRCTVRVPTVDTVFEMFHDAGFNMVQECRCSATESGSLSDIYFNGRAGIFFAEKINVEGSRFDQ